jgi:hypothetical protein
MRCVYCDVERSVMVSRPLASDPLPPLTSPHPHTRVPPLTPSFTFGQPHFRKRYLVDRPEWRFSQATIGPPEGFDYFQYMLEWDPEANKE